MKTDALILAGGNSSRMGGQHKGSLLWHGKSFTELMVRELKKRADTVYLSCGRQAVPDTSGCIAVQDIYPGCGPIGGLHAGLKKSTADFVLTAPCDMPLLKAELYDFLLSFLTGEPSGGSSGMPDAVVPLLDRRPEPLAAVYRPSCSLFFEQQLKTGCYRLRPALDRMHVVYPDISENPQLASMMENINSPADYASLLEKK